MSRVFASVLLVVALVAGMGTLAAADVVTDVSLAFDTPSGSTNRMTLEVWAGGNVDTGIFGTVYVSSSDTETTTVSGNMVMDLDCTFDPNTFEVTSVTGMNFTGGTFAFSDVHFDLPFSYSIIGLGHVYADGEGVGGTFNTANPFPPANVTGNHDFDMTDHEVVVNQGTLDIHATGIVGNYVDPMTYDLSTPANWIYATTEGSGYIAVAKRAGADHVYDVHVEVPLDIDETIYDDGDISATLKTTSTAIFATTGSFTYIPSNHPPVAVNDSYSTDEDTACIRNSLTGVLANDTDADEDPLTAYKLTNPQHGDVTLDSNGAFTYTPDENYFGTDSFTYRAYDGEDWSDAGTVNVDVIPINDAPVAEDDSFSVNENGILVLYANESILVNDTDVDDDHATLTAERQTDPTHGRITWWAANGGLRYEPDPGFSGIDSFTYLAFDGEDYSELATAVIEVIGTVKIPGDTNGDKKVDDQDAAVLAANWGESHSGASNGDFDGDGFVGPADAAILAANWGDYNEAAAAVPEPSTLALLLAGLLGAAALAGGRR